MNLTPQQSFFLEKFYKPVVKNETNSSINGFDFDLNNISILKDSNSRNKDELFRSESIDSTNNDSSLSEDCDDSVKDPDFCGTSSNDDNAIIEDFQLSSSDPEGNSFEADLEMEVQGQRMENDLQAESGKYKKVIRQKCRNSGVPYKTLSGKVIKERVCKPFDICRFNCQKKVNFEACMMLFNHYWSLGTYDLRVLYMGSLMNIKDKKCDTLVNSTARKRQRENSVKYSLSLDGKAIRVCRRHFTQCFGETESFVKSVIRKKLACPTVSLKSSRGKSAPPNKINSEKLEEVKNHINNFPAYESHYTRRDTSQKYLHSDLTLSKMYQLYTDETENPISLSKYSQVFRSMNLKFKSPQLDTCSTCDTLKIKIKYAAGTEEESKLKELKKQHVEKADNAYNYKRADKKEAKYNKNTKAFAFDLQQCLPTPSLRSSICFYKRQLWTYNLTVHDLEDDSAQCFMWHEAVARRGGNEIASCVYRKLNMIDKTVTKICFYSDSCTGQNKNSHVSSMFIIFANNNPHIEFIDHKFLEPGHTHMECDSDHALIERKKKKSNVEIQIPRDWYQFVRSVHPKMHVVEMRANNFFSFSELKKSKFIWRQCNENGERFIWNEVRWMRYTKDISCIFYKTSLDIDEPFKVLKIGKRGISSINNIDLQVISAIPAISQEKKKDLLDMKIFIDPEFHSFYDNLHSNSNEHYNIHPDLVDEEQDVNA